MELELRENMYIRTNEGIRKILNEFEEGYELDRCLHYCYPEGHDLYKEDLEDDENKIVTKSSFNIIDLIEEGDYINGQEVYYDEELDFLYVQSFDADDCFYQESITKESFINNIKTILTKEQFEYESYKVGE